MLQEKMIYVLLLGLASALKGREAEGTPVGFLRKCPVGTLVLRSKARLQVGPLFRIQAGDELVASAPLEIYYTRTGKVYRIEPGQTIVVDAQGVWLKGKRQEAKIIQTHAQGAVSVSLTTRASRSMGFLAREAGPPRPLSHPLPYGAVESATALTLRWTNKLTPKLIGNQKLLVTLSLFDSNEPFTGQLIAPTSESFVVPEGAIVPGQLYKWKVSLPEGPLGAITVGAPLWVLDKNEVAAAGEARADATKAGSKDDQVHFLLGERLWALGLFSEALAAFQEALMRNPGNESLKKTIAFLEGRLNH